MRRKTIRRITVGTGEWRYRVGHSFVRFIAPDGKSYNVSIPRVKGQTWDDLERGRWKHPSDGMVTPGEIARYLGDVDYEHVKADANKVSLPDKVRQPVDDDFEDTEAIRWDR